MKAVVTIYLKEGVLDPQGKAVHHALLSLGHKEVQNVRIGKRIVLELAHTDEAKAKADIRNMCEEILANTVIEEYDFEILS